MPDLQLADVRLHYRDVGTGPVIVLIHGLGDSGADWDQQIPDLARDHRVIAPDLRGYGHSERRGPYSIERFAADVLALVDALAIDDFVLVGHSMGGAVSMQLALGLSAVSPSRITKLVLANTLPSFRPRTAAQWMMLWSRLILMPLLGPQRLGRLVAEQLYPGAERAALRAGIVARSANNSRSVYMRTLLNISRWSVEDRLPQLKLPVLILASEFDYFDAVHRQHFIGLIPQAESTLFEGLHHGLPREAPARFNARLRQFIGGA